MYEIIESIINEWDPIKLFPLAPKDEYKFEIVQIVQFIEDKKDIKVVDLSNKIYQIFNNSFGGEILVNKSECDKIANSIIKSL